ncbi:hypothetical protein AB0J35_08285 [Nonomuraea angiospora]|uniref:hypothetical protein n=1 Tax=Nonomuraea angiospora TaxID=46172 RepID=UPI00341A1D15
MIAALSGVSGRHGTVARAMGGETSSLVRRLMEFHRRGLRAVTGRMTKAFMVMRGRMLTDH